MRELSFADLEAAVGGVIEDGAYAGDGTYDGTDDGATGGTSPTAYNLALGEGRTTYTIPSTNYYTLPTWYRPPGG